MLNKVFLTFLSCLFIALISCGAAACWYFIKNYEAPGPLERPVLFEVKRGQGVASIAAGLEARGMIDSALVFRGAARLLDKGRNLKAGEYEIPAGASTRDILTLLYEGKVFAHTVTVPEGLTSFETVRLLKGHERLKGDIDDVPPEGSLLPETYHFTGSDTKAALINRMKDAMVAALLELCEIKAGTEKEPPNLENLLDRSCGAAPLKTVRDVLTLASIVEKETGQSDERKRVAGVFINRLKRGMALQTDPTVIYAITKGAHKNDGKGPLGRRLLKKDLEYDSPYNTYLYPGLPPGPIANPGRASIEAVINPEVHDYYYFVADGTGGHAFGKTLTEHNENVAKWRKIRRAMEAEN